MRVSYTPHSEQFWASHFAQRGGSISPFEGYAYQRGGGLGNIFKSLLRVVLPMAKSAGKTIGKQALKSGANAAADILEGRDPAEALLSHGRHGAARMVRKAAGQKKKKKKQTGKGVGKRPTQRKVFKGRITRKQQAPKKKGNKRTKKDILGEF